MFGYVAAIFLGPLIPLVLYVAGRRRSPLRRFHTAMALNLSLTGLLYALCCLILCGLLLLDSLAAALAVAIPVALVIWISVLKYLIRGIGAANRGERYEVPAWICAKIAKPLGNPVDHQPGAAPCGCGAGVAPAISGCRRDPRARGPGVMKPGFHHPLVC